MYFRLPILLEIFIDKQRKAVGQGAEIKATQVSGWILTSTIDHVTLKVSLALSH